MVARPRPRPPPLTTPHELKEHWLNRALERAGIDRSRWRPAAGVDANRATIEAVYRYYGALCGEHPELQWAGMASLIGPAFYAGFMDVALLRLTGGDVFYETTFLTMQKKIFEDQATMHEAFLAGGAEAIAELHGAHIVDSATLEGWRQIARGPARGGQPDAAAARAARHHRPLLRRDARPPATGGLGVHLPDDADRRAVGAGRQGLSRALSAHARRRADPAADAAGRRQHRDLRQPLAADRGGHAAGLPGVRPRPPGRGAVAHGDAGGTPRAAVPAAGARRADPARRGHALGDRRGADGQAARGRAHGRGHGRSRGAAGVGACG